MAPGLTPVETGKYYMKGCERKNVSISSAHSHFSEGPPDGGTRVEGGVRAIGLRARHKQTIAPNLCSQSQSIRTGADANAVHQREC